MANILTRGEIITQGLARAGNTAIRVHARHFLNAWENHVHRSHDWDHLRKTSAVTTGSPAYEILTSGITDYRAALSLRLATVGPLRENGNYEALWERIERDLEAGATGIPMEWAADPAGGKLILWPVPAVAYSGKLRYLHLPAKVAVTGDATDATFDASVSIFPDAEAMIAAVEAFALRWDKDIDLSQAAEIVAAQKLREVRANTDDKGRGATTALELDPDTFGYFTDF